MLNGWRNQRRVESPPLGVHLGMLSVPHSAAAFGTVPPCLTPSPKMLGTLPKTLVQSRHVWHAPTGVHDFLEKAIPREKLLKEF